MDVTAKVSTKGQVTIPKHVRDELGITAGDELVFRVEPHRVLVARTPNLLAQDSDLDALPEAPRNVPWDAARHAAARRPVEKREPGTVVVRDTDRSPLTIELVERRRIATRR